MKVTHLFSALLFGSISLFLFSACNGTDPIAPTPGKYAKGIFVVNEGPFGGTGSITWHNPETGATEQDIFAAANNGAVLGEFVQSLTFHNGKGYIVVNGANKIYVVNGETFVFEDTIGGLELPRFFLPLDATTALVSQWGANGLNGSVAKVDLTDNRVLNTIPTGSGAEKMLRFDNNTVYVANSGGFGTDSTWAVVNLSANTATRENVGGKNPGSLARGRLNGADVVFALCKGSYLDAVPTGFVGTRNSAWVVVDPYGEDLVSSPDGEVRYFVAGGKIYRHTASNLTTLVENQAGYGLQISPDGTKLYCADPKDFSSAGEVVIYNVNGGKEGSFPTGVAPSEVVVK